MRIFCKSRFSLNRRKSLAWYPGCEVSHKALRGRRYAHLPERKPFHVVRGPDWLKGGTHAGAIDIDFI